MIVLFALAAQAAAADPPAPVARVVARRDAAEQGVVPGLFRVELDGLISRPLNVRYRVSGSARNGQDYTLLPGEVTIPAGATGADILIRPVDDHLEEEDEGVRIELLPADQPFELVVLPDTQYYTAEAFGGRSSMFSVQTRWIAETCEENNIVFALHEGDITDRNTVSEWQRAQASLALLEGVVPYALAVGNHDGIAGPIARTDRFNAAFPLRNYAHRPGFGSAFEPDRMDNVCWTFEAGGLRWLVLVLEFGPRDAVLDWANQVVADHPEHRAILLTHAYLYNDDTWIGSDPGQLWQPTAYGRPNNGTDLWNKLLRRHPNVALVFSGHVLFEGTGRRVDLGDAGNAVYQMLANYQTYPGGGSGFLRRIRFFPAEDRFEVRTYSPYLDQWRNDPENCFEYRNLGWFVPGTAPYTLAPDAASASLVLANNDSDPTPPRLLRIVHRGPQGQFRLVFDRILDPASAATAANYRLSTPAVTADQTPLTAQLLADRRTVAIQPPDRLTPHQIYQLAVVNLRGTRGIGILESPLASGFLYEPSLIDTDFSLDGLAGWRVEDSGKDGGPSDWIVRDGQVLQLSRISGPAASAVDHRAGTALLYDDPGARGWTNYTVTASFNSSEENGVGLMLRYRDSGNYLKLELDRQRRFRKLFEVVGGVETTLATEPAGYELLTDQALRVELADDQVFVFLNTVPVFGGPVRTRAPGSGTFGLYCWRNSGVVFDHVDASPLDRAPVVDFLLPEAFGSVEVRRDLPIAVAAVDPDGTILRVELWGDGIALGTIDRAPYEFVWQDVPAGPHSMVAAATDSEGRVTRTRSRLCNVTRLPPPEFIQPPASQVVAAGENVLFAVRVAWAPAAAYAWLLDGRFIPGATNSYLMLNSVRPAQAGDYQLRVTSLGESQTSPAAKLTVGLPLNVPNEDPVTPPHIEALLVDPWEPRALRVWAPRGTRLILETSTDLGFWTAVGSATNNGSWSGFIVPPAAPGQPEFYRAFGRRVGP